MRGKTKTCRISELPFLSLHSAVSPVSISLMVFVIFPFVVVVWVCQMGFFLKFLTPLWEDPNAHYKVWLGRKAHGTTVLAAHQPLASTPHTAPKAAPGHCCERQQWDGAEGQGSLGKLADSLNCRTELPAVGGQQHVTSSAEMQLGAAMQATADSLCFAWLKCRLAPKSLSARTCWEHKLHKSNSSLQARTGWPRNRQNQGKTMISLQPFASCCPKRPGAHRAKLVPQK